MSSAPTRASGNEDAATCTERSAAKKDACAKKLTQMGARKRVGTETMTDAGPANILRQSADVYDQAVETGLAVAIANPRTSDRVSRLHLLIEVSSDPHLYNRALLSRVCRGAREKICLQANPVGCRRLR
jgi:hypothetical protein